MAYHTLLLPLSDVEGVDGVVDVAAQLAPGAHLIGTHVLPSPALYGYHELGMTVSLGDAWVIRRRELADRIGDAFRARSKASGLAAEWHVVEDPLDTVEGCIVEMGNSADAIVMARHGRARDAASRNALTGRVLLGSGRPVVIVPRERAPGPVGRRVLVAWDGAAASTRALWNALPVLRAADAVRVQRVSAHVPSGERRTPAGLEELAAALARHGVDVEVGASQARPAEVGEELLGVAGDVGADAIVAGGYGHGPVRGFLLGDTTHHLLEHARVPLIMSH